MQDTTLLNENTRRASQILETDYEILSKPSSAITEHKRVLSRVPSSHADSAVSPKITHRHKRSYSYEPAASDRESWWRVTIKVYFQIMYLFIYIHMNRIHQILVRMIHI
jgi:hypothetical protein